MSWWSQYRGRSAGRIIHAMYVYAGLQVAEEITIGSHYVTLHGRIIAHCEWEGEETPHFTFYDIKDPSYLKDQPRHWRRAQFIKKPFLDDRVAEMYANYITQEVKKAITYQEALSIRHVWDVLDGDFAVLSSGTPAIKAKIMKVIADDSHGHLADRAEELWQHFAFCAVYEDLKRVYCSKPQATVV